MSIIEDSKMPKENYLVKFRNKISGEIAVSEEVPKNSAIAQVGKIYYQAKKMPTLLVETKFFIDETQIYYDTALSTLAEPTIDDVSLIIITFTLNFTQFYTILSSHSELNLDDLNRVDNQDSEPKMTIRDIRRYIQAVQVRIDRNECQKYNKCNYLNDINYLKDILAVNPWFITAFPEILESAELWLTALELEHRLHFFCNEMYLRTPKIQDFLNRNQIKYED